MIHVILLASLAIGANGDLEAKASAIKPTPRELTWLGVPWVLGLAEMMIFIALFLVAYVYAWRKGALEWD